MKLLRAQWFTAAMIGLFALAWLWPGLAQAADPGGWVKTAAIVVIFLVSGLGLKTEESLRALGAWRLHLFIQGFSLVLIPAVCWLIVWPLSGRLPEALVVGLYLLAAVPTTVTSCVVFTQLAGGNTAAALFNAVAGNLLGIFVSPALVILMLGASGLAIELDAWAVFGKLCATVLLPFALGQVFHRRALAWPGFKRSGSRINRWCVLLIIYLAFGDVFAKEAPDVAWQTVWPPLALLVPAHLLLLWACHAGSRLAGFARPERIAVLFCAPQKTLTLGLPMAAAVLAKRPDLLGLASLPLLVYHPLQLMIGGVLQERLRVAGEALVQQTTEPPTKVVRTSDARPRG